MPKGKPKLDAKAALPEPMRLEDLGPILFLIDSMVIPDPSVWELDLPGRALLVSVKSYGEALETQRLLRRKLFPVLPASLKDYLRATRAMSLLRETPDALEKLPRATPRSIADMVPSSAEENLEAFVKRFVGLVKRAPDKLTMNQAVYLALLAASGDVERAPESLEGLRSLDNVVSGSGNWRAAQEMRPIAEGREARVTLRIRMGEDGEPEVEMHTVFPPGWGPDRRAEALRAAARALLQEAERVDARTE
jgi:hypothetical protein